MSDFHFFIAFITAPRSVFELYGSEITDHIVGDL